jgi:uncharacterized protein (DUF1684 family)
MSDLDEFRKAKDDFFGHDHQSPLTPEQRRDFRGLSYYPENRALVVKGSLDPEVEAGDVPMEATGGGQQVYTRAGIVRFTVDEQPAQLTLFAQEDQHELFVPFRDATSGKGSYPAGRYLEVEPPDAGGQVTVDFNLAYNPYCAYNPEYSCPLPPVENWLKVPIEAGEKTFAH